MEIKWIELESRGDKRGQLIIAESQKNIPFEIKRVYCLYDMGSMPRGFHAHKELQQVMVCLTGNCSVMLDDGTEKHTILINKDKPGILIDKFIWHEMSNFSQDCILMVLASDYYDESDYIRNYNQFITEAELNHDT